MYTIEGICDWCKKPSLLTKHEYIDGVCHHSCQTCFDFAALDVRQYNRAELQQRERQARLSL